MSAGRIVPTEEQGRMLAQVRESQSAVEHRRQDLQQANQQRQARVVAARGDGCTWPMIAEQLGITTSGARKIATGE